MSTLEPSLEAHTDTSPQEEEQDPRHILDMIFTVPNKTKEKQPLTENGLFDRKSSLNNEIRLLKRSIYFLENIALIDESEMPELRQYKKRLIQTQQEIKKIEEKLLLLT